MILLSFLIAYLLGSISTSVWVSRWVFKIDIRDYGSGNAGATNSFRFLGKKWGMFIFFVDMFKGLLAVKLINIFHLHIDNSINLELTLGFFSIIGHIFPVFEGFRGGKGVATFFGVVIAIQPKFALIFAAVFFLTFVITNYVALGSMIAAITFVFCIVFFIHQSSLWVAITLASLCALLIIIKHHTNIKRLLNKTETKMFLTKKKNEKIDTKTP